MYTNVTFGVTTGTWPVVIIVRVYHFFISFYCSLSWVCLARLELTRLGYTVLGLELAAVPSLRLFFSH